MRKVVMWTRVKLEVNATIPRGPRGSWENQFRMVFTRLRFQHLSLDPRTPLRHTLAEARRVLEARSSSVDSIEAASPR